MSFKLIITIFIGFLSLMWVIVFAQPPHNFPPPFDDNHRPDFRRPPPPHERFNPDSDRANTRKLAVATAGSQVNITEDDHYRYITSNGIPAHQFGPFRHNQVSAQKHQYRVTKNPRKNKVKTSLMMGASAILLNGVPVDTLSAECWNVAQHRCHNASEKWRENAMAEGKFNLDGHHAHVQPDGTYHYHGDPNAIYSHSHSSAIIGYAADGFPIYGPYIKDAKDSIRRAKSSYQLRHGQRPSNAPNGNYNGDYNDDFKFILGSGDLDECNGGELMGRSYGYYVTSQYPYLISCFKGIPDSSFGHRRGGRR